MIRSRFTSQRKVLGKTACVLAVLLAGAMPALTVASAASADIVPPPPPPPSGGGGDTTPPVVTVTGVTNGATYILGAVPTAGCTTMDTQSGVATYATLSTSGGPVGPVTVTCSGATDNAGNTATDVTVTYTVIYKFIGFLPPLNSDSNVVNTGNAGRTYPIKWQLTDASGNYISDAASNTTVSVVMVSGSNLSGDPADPIDYASTTGGTALRYDSTSNQYIYNWATPAAKGAYYRMTVTTPDGQSHVAYFYLK